jgi:DNA-binding transcriptional MerR regulator
MVQEFTESQVERMLGIGRAKLGYWARLHLISPRARWGTRFYNFSDLVALEAIRRMTERRVPVRRLQRALAAFELASGAPSPGIASLRLSSNGTEVVVWAAEPESRPIEPLTGQYVFDFDAAALLGRGETVRTGELPDNVRAMVSYTAEYWFEIGMSCDAMQETLPQAAEAYGKAVAMAPEWVEAHINLGTTFYQLERMPEARQEFSLAVQLEPRNALARFNLGCVLEHDGETQAAIAQLREAVDLAPQMADAHLNLALAYEKVGRKHESTRHLSFYLRYDPNGPWADFARTRLASQRPPGADSGKLTPFRRVR